MQQQNSPDSTPQQTDTFVDKNVDELCTILKNYAKTEEIPTAPVNDQLQEALTQAFENGKENVDNDIKKIEIVMSRNEIQSLQDIQEMLFAIMQRMDIL